MLKKTALALAAAAAFGAAALAPTAVSAAPWHHHHHHGWWGFYGAPAFYAPAYYGYYNRPGCYVGRRWVWTHSGWVLARRPICY